MELVIEKLLSASQVKISFDTARGKGEFEFSDRTAPSVKITLQDLRLLKETIDILEQEIYKQTP